MKRSAVKARSLPKGNVALDDEDDGPNDPLMEKAVDWMLAITSTNDVASVLPQLNAWLRESPAHGRAFEWIRCVWRLAEPLLRAGKPGAGVSESEAFWDALEEEQARSPKLFADA